MVVKNQFPTMQQERNAEEEAAVKKKEAVKKIEFFFSCDYNVNQCR